MDEALEWYIGGFLFALFLLLFSSGASFKSFAGGLPSQGRALLVLALLAFVAVLTLGALVVAELVSPLEEIVSAS